MPHGGVAPPCQVRATWCAVLLVRATSTMCRCDASMWGPVVHGICTVTTIANEVLYNPRDTLSVASSYRRGVAMQGVDGQSPSERPPSVVEAPWVVRTGAQTSG